MSDKPIYISKARRKAFDKGLTWELVKTMDAKQLSIYLGEAVTDKAQLHELSGDDYLNRAFELSLEKHIHSPQEELVGEQREVTYRYFKEAFLHGVTAHANGNYY
ncbi:hypothetical protein A5gp_00081 [Alteromonas phage vB_AemP_PT15-A5]|nr:hypothetical protein A5gp_00081 [Alteromonas phage vB_AemP_PT15-A5]